MQLQSFVLGRWQAGAGNGVTLRDATTGEVIANATADGLDAAAILEHARSVGGREPAPAELSRARGAAQGARQVPRRAQGGVLPALLCHRRDEDAIPGSTSTAASARCSSTRARARASCPTAACMSTARSRRSPRPARSWGSTSACRSRVPRFTSTPSTFRCGACWRSSPRRCWPGYAAVVKPATQTCYLTERVVRRIIESGILPEGAVQLICGGRRGAVRAPDLSGRGLVHRLGLHRAQAAPAPGGAAELGALHRRDRFAQFLDSRPRTSPPARRNSICSSRKWCAR